MHKLRSSLLWIQLVAAAILIHPNVEAASVGGGGYTNAFGTQPGASDWSTFSIGGAAADVTTAGGMDSAVQLVSAASITAATLADAGAPPAANASATWSSAGFYLQTRPTGNQITLLMCTLVNGLGVNAGSATIGFDLAINSPLGEDVDGIRAYYSLTGAAGSWVPVAGLTGATATRLTATINATWNAGASLYLVFADDNGPNSPDTGFQIDNFSAIATPDIQVPAAITLNPVDQSAAELQQAVTFTAAASGNPPPTWQWYTNGVAIPGATAANYTINAAPLHFNGLQFRAVAQNVVTSITYYATSTVATLTVNADVVAPVLLGISQAGNNQAVAWFSERVTAATATNLANLSITSVLGALTISNAVLDASQTNLIFTTAPLTPSTTYTLTVNGVADQSAAANLVAANSQASFTAAAITYADIGSPPIAGSIVQGGNGFDITSAGSGISGTSDQFTIGYQQVAGDFDVKVRLNAFQAESTLATAGLMARETLTANSRFAATLAGPNVAGTYFSSRATLGGTAANAGWHPVNYPYTWLRLQRAGNLLSGYASLDGQNWVLLGNASLTGLPSTLFVGFVVTSANTAQTAAVQFRDYGLAAGGSIVAFNPTREPLGASSRRTGLVISEIMYHPKLRPDGKQLEFIEIYNSLPYFENLSGHRISGDFNYSFPSNTIIQGGGFLVLAKVKADVESVYGLSGVLEYGVTNGFNTNVVGGVTNVTPNIDNGLNNAGGRVRLHSMGGAILLDVTFETDYPWPIESDGGGHSLVLARPSYGEGSRLAWAASDSIGGSPGGYDPILPDPARNVVINEFLAHTDPPLEDGVELYNHGNTPVDLSGFWLSDTVTTNKYRIADGTVLGPRGFIAFTATTNAGPLNLGFALSSAGEQIVLVNSNQTRVIDAIGFEGQENGVSMGRYPDGAPVFQRLSALTPGTTNAAPLASPVVINEIMYNPISGDSDDEFIELYNRSTNAVNIGNWRFTSGIDYTFPPNTIIHPGSYVVVARNETQLQASYPAGTLNATNLFGNYGGSLANSGERVALSAPDYEVTTNGLGQVLTNVAFRYVVNEVAYRKGGRWGVWADGGGSSLELVDPRSDNSLAANWADSDETTKSTWTSFEATGRVDDEWGGQTHDNVHVYLLGVGEALVDDIEIRPQPGNANIMINGGFENGLSNWVPQGSHDQSFIENAGFTGTKSLHLMGASRGDPGANKVRSATGGSFTTTFALNDVVTMRAKARWLRGFPEVLLRFHGGGMEAAGRLPVPKNLGTPGAVNSQYRGNNGPAVYDVVHTPILPAANENVVVTARVNDPDGISTLLLRYRIDPNATLNNLTMLDNGTGGDAVAGDGLYSATIPGQAAGTLAAFHIQAADNAVVKATNLFPANALIRTFPSDGPKHECLVRWGEQVMPGSYSTYRFWITDEMNTRWNSRVRLNNAGLDSTFVYNNYRVIYNAAPQYGGSVWHVGSMLGPLNDNSRVDFVMNFPEDDLLLGQTDFIFNTVGNPSGNTSSDTSAQAEQTSYILFRQMGLHYNYRRYIHLWINGSRRSTTSGTPFIMEDSQQPNGDVVREWWPDDSDGQLYKIEDRFEYNDAGDSHGGNEGNAQLTRQMSLYNGVNQLKLAHYRFMFRKRSIASYDSASDYTNLFAVVDIISPTNNASISPLTDPMVKQLSQVADLEQWMRIFCVQHTCGNWDSYGYRRGKNAYTYRPNLGKFAQMTWDIDFTMGVGGDGTGQDIFQVNDPRIAALFGTPEVRRMYWRAMRDMINGPLNNSYLDPILDAKMAAHLANGVQASAGTLGTIKSYVAGRRAYIAGLIPNANFNFTSPTNFTSSSNIVTLTGTAPIDIKFFEINGIAYPVTWVNETSWSVRVPVNSSGSNNFAFEGFDRLSNSVPGTLRSVIVDYTGAIEGPQTNIVFNEIMYNPLVPGAEFVEFFNRSTNFTFDLSGWRVNGLDYTFPEGATIGPRAFLVLTKDRVQYANAYGGLAPAFDQFTGELQLDGETLTLIKPAATTNDVDLVVDRVRYDGALPWPAAANGTGSSFQLIDHAQDNHRVGNWFASYSPAQYCCGVSTPAQVLSGWRFVSVTGAAGPGAGANQMRLVINLGNGEINGSSVVLDDISVVEGTTAAVGYNFVRNGDFESTPLLEVPPVTNSWFIGTNYTNTAIIGDPVHAGSGALKLVCQTFGNAQPRVVSQLLSPAPLTNAIHTLSFWYNATNTATNLTVKLLNSGPLNVTTNIGVFIIPSNYIPPQLVAPATNTLSPGAANQQTATLPAFPTLWINELQADNVSGLLDNNNEHEPWIEIYNAGSAPVSLDGLYLSTTYTNLTNFAIPPGYSIGPTQFMVIICDGEPGESTPAQLHTGFMLPSGAGSIALSRLYNSAPQVLDYINYNGISAGRSYGSFPDGQPFDRQEFFYVTPGGTNDGRSAPLVAFINEWMANNVNFLADPADNDYDDWFELYNPSTNAVDIAGYYLTDTLANKFKYLITTNGPHVIPAQGFLLVWADNETGQNVAGGVPRPDLHVNFQLATAGEAIGLFAADGTQVDAITFTNAAVNASEGRYPNGGPLVYAMPTNQTPRASNYVPGIGNNPPVLDPIGTRTVFVDQSLTFTATATDPDAGQSLGFTLDPGFPPGASIDFNTGEFAWTPGVAGTNIITIRVTDNGAPALSDYENVVVRVLTRPDFASPSLSGSLLTLTWNAVGGRTYQVKYKNELGDAWQNLGLPLTLESDGVLTIDDNINNSPNGHRFYQLFVLP